MKFEKIIALIPHRLSMTLTGILLLIAATLSQTTADTNTKTALDSTPLRVALLPDEDAATVIKNNSDFKHYLKTKLNKEIELVVATDYSSMIEAVRHKRVDLAYFGPLSYVLAKSRSDIEAFAAKTNNGSPTYHSVIIANQSSKITSLSALKGKNIVFGDPASTSSHLIPKAMLLSAGLERSKDYKEHFVGAHDAVALAVQNGSATAGGLSKPIFESLVERGIIDLSKVAVLAESSPFPQYPWALQSTLGSHLKQTIKTAFYELNDKSILKRFKADGMSPINDDDYDVVRELKAALNL